MISRPPIIKLSNFLITVVRGNFLDESFPLGHIDFTDSTLIILKVSPYVLKSDS